MSGLKKSFLHILVATFVALSRTIYFFVSNATKYAKKDVQKPPFFNPCGELL